MDNLIEIQTPIGELVAWFNDDIKRPEIFIDLVKANGDSVPLVAAMVNTEDNCTITARVYEDLNTEDGVRRTEWTRDEVEALTSV